MWIPADKTFVCSPLLKPLFNFELFQFSEKPPKVVYQMRQEDVCTVESPPIREHQCSPLPQYFLWENLLYSPCWCDKKKKKK